MLSISSFINPEVSYAIFQSLLHSLWQIPLLALGIKLITNFKSKPSVQKTYHANLSAIIMSMLAAGFTFLYYSLRGIKTIDVLESGTATLSNSSTEFFAIVDGAQPASLSWSEWLIQYNDVIVLFWIIGATLFLSRIIAGWLGLHFLKKDLHFQISDELSSSFQKIIRQLNIKKPVRLALSSIATVPMIIGHLKPIVLLPIATINHLSQEEVESILVHELAHILHFDFVKNLIVILGESIFFYHPVIWLLSSEIKEEREHLCDDTVVRIFPNRIQYAKTLVKLGAIYQKQNNHLSLALFNNKFKLMKRIKRILNISNESKFGNTKIVVIGLLLCSIVVFSSADVIQKIKGQHTIETVESIDQLTFETLEIPLDHSIPDLSENTSKSFRNQEVPKSANYKSRAAIVEVLAEVSNFTTHNSVRTPESEVSLFGITIPIPPAPPVAPLLNSFDFYEVSTMQDTLPPEERERLKAEMKVKREELRAQYKEQREKMKASREKIKGEYKEQLKKKKEELKKVREKLGEDGNSFHFHFDDDMSEEEVEAWAADMAEWGEKWGEQFEEQFDEEWVHDMEEWGKRFGEEFAEHFDEDWVQDMEAWGEEFGEKMAVWGEEFGEKFGEEFDNEWTTKFEHLGETMENTFTEEWLEDVAEIGEKVSRAVKEAMEGIEDNHFHYKYSHNKSEDRDGLKAHLVENLNEEGLLTDKNNTIIITDHKMTANGKTLSSQQLKSFKSLVQKYSHGAFRDGKTKVKFKIQGKDLDTSKSTGLTIDIND